VTLPSAAQDTDTIHAAALALLDRVSTEGRRVRLTGVSVSGLVASAPELTLFPDQTSAKRRRVEEVAAQIADRFADEHAVTRASLLQNRTRPRTA
jgi:hypothetical protein